VIFIPHSVLMCWCLPEDVLFYECLRCAVLASWYIWLLSAAATDHQWLWHITLCHSEAQLESRQPVSSQF